MGFDGFDGVELVMALEDRLGISISDRDAERLRTPNDAVEYVVGRVNARQDSAEVHCRSAAAFRKGRRQCAELFGFSHAALRPSTPLIDLLPLPADVVGRHTAWKRLSTGLNVGLPRLRHPRGWQAAAVLVGLATFAGMLSWSACHKPATVPGVAIGAALSVIGLLGLPAALLAMTRRRLAAELPAGFVTVNDVTSCLTLKNIPASAASCEGWTRHEIGEMVRDLTAESAGCPPARIDRHTSWPA